MSRTTSDLSDEAAVNSLSDMIGGGVTSVVCRDEIADLLAPNLLLPISERHVYSSASPGNSS